VSVGAVGGCGTRAAACLLEQPPANTLPLSSRQPTHFQRPATMRSESARVSKASGKFSAALADCDSRLASNTRCIKTHDPSLNGACCGSAPFAPLSVALDANATLKFRMGGGCTATCGGRGLPWMSDLNPGTKDLNPGTKSAVAATPTPNYRRLAAPPKWQPSLSRQPRGPVTATGASGFRNDLLHPVEVQTKNCSRQVLCPWYTRNDARSTKEGTGDGVSSSAE
jgi:hypothetical protein